MEFGREPRGDIGVSLKQIVVDAVEVRFCFW